MKRLPKKAWLEAGAILCMHIVIFFPMFLATPVFMGSYEAAMSVGERLDKIGPWVLVPFLLALLVVVHFGTKNDSGMGPP